MPDFPMKGIRTSRTKGYSKASAITPSDSTLYGPGGAKFFSALYIGDGNFEANVVASELFSPKLWLKANTGVTDSGGAISAWADQSGNSHNAAATNAPTVEAGVAATNGLATIDFDNAGANDDGLKVTDHADFDFDGVFSMMAVVKFDAVNANQAVMAKDKHSSEWTWICDDGVMKFHVSSNDPVGAATLSTDTWYVVGVQRDVSNNMQLYLNNATDGSSVSNTEDFSGTDDLYIGQRLENTTPTYGQGMDGEIAEILVWKEHLSAKEREVVYTYLTDKWFNAKKADVAVVLDGVTTTLKKRDVGTIIVMNPATKVMATNTNATNIVALYED